MIELQELYPDGIFLFDGWIRKFRKFGKIVPANQIPGESCTVFKGHSLPKKVLKDLPFDLVLVHPGPVEVIYRVNLHDERRVSP